MIQYRCNGGWYFNILLSFIHFPCITVTVTLTLKILFYLNLSKHGYIHSMQVTTWTRQIFARRINTFCNMMILTNDNRSLVFAIDTSLVNCICIKKEPSTLFTTALDDFVIFFDVVVPEPSAEIVFGTVVQ